MARRLHPAPAGPPRWLVAAMTGGLLLSGCGGADAAGGTPQATDACQAVEFPPVQFGSHLIGDAEPPVPYSSVPPSSGWHLSGPATTGVATTPMSEPAQVATLEAGGVVVTYRDLDDGDVQVLADLADDNPDVVAVTSYDGIDPGQVVLASWGALQRCDGVDSAALTAFVAAYGNDVTTFEE